MLDMIFRDGFYHADPHPGNVFVLPGGRLGMLDCGKVGRVDEQTRDDFLTIVTAFLTRDVDGLTEELIRLCDVPLDLDRKAYRADVADFVGEFAEVSSAQLNLGAAFESMFAIIRRYHLTVPARVNMLLLVVVQTEGTARQLDPQFNLVDALEQPRRRPGAAAFRPQLDSSARRCARSRIGAACSTPCPRGAGPAGADPTRRSADPRAAARAAGTAPPADPGHSHGGAAARLGHAVGHECAADVCSASPSSARWAWRWGWRSHCTCFYLIWRAE